MSSRARIIAGLTAVIALIVPASQAAALSVSIQSLSPGTTVMAKNQVTFKIAPDFTAHFYTIADSFAGTTLAQDAINAGGNVSWLPTARDVGTHTLTITARSVMAEVANTTLTITVTPPPSVTIQSLSPGETAMPGTPVTFTVQTTGITNPQYAVTDSFSGTSISNSNISSAGQFSWTPDHTQNGNHDIEVNAYDSQGHGASAKTRIRIGTGPTLTISPATTTIIVAPYAPVRFTAVASNYSPTSFGASDTFANSSVNNSNIDTSGSFSWTPTMSDIGIHTITVLGTVGTYGDRASTPVKVIVLRADGTMPPEAITLTVPATAVATAAVASAAPAGTLAALLAQLANLQAKMASLKNPTVATASAAAAVSSSPAASSYRFTRFIGPSYSGTEVRKLQERLTELGYLTVKPNGYFGPATTAAVKALQLDNDLEPKGHVGPGTRAILNAE